MTTQSYANRAVLEQLNEKQKAKLLPTRANGLARPLKARDAKHEPLHVSYAESLQAGAEREGDAGLQGLQKAALALLLDPKPLEAYAGADREVMAAAWALWPSGGACAALVLTRGVEETLEVILRSVDLGGKRDEGQLGHTLVDGQALEEIREGSTREGGLEPLRNAVCASDEATYAKLRARILEGWKARALTVNALFAYVFPDEPWGGELIEALQRTPKSQWFLWHGLERRPFLLSACHDIGPIRTYLGEGYGPEKMADWALQLAVALRPEVAEPLFGELLAKLLQKPKRGSIKKEPPRKVLEALILVASEPAAIVAPYVGHPILGPQAAAYFARHEQARAALKRSKGRSAKALADRYQESAEARGPTGKLAKDSDIPAILRERWWRSKAQPEVPIVEDEAERQPKRAPFKERVEPCPPDLEDQHPHNLDVDGVLEAYAEWGVRSMSWAFGPWLETLGRMISSRIAPIFAHLYADRKAARRAAFLWFTAHPEVAASGLIPDAVGPANERKSRAVAALALLKRAGHEEAVRRAAHAFAKKVQNAVDVVLSLDARVIERGPGKLPPFLDTSVPTVLLADGKTALPPEAVDALLELLRVAPSDYPWYAELRAALDADSLAKLVDHLLHAWTTAGGPGAHDWMMRAAVAFPHETTTRRLGELLRGWAQKKRAPAQRVLEALTDVGTDAALVQLGQVMSRSRFADLRELAQASLSSIAAERGLDREQLQDRITPDLGLDARGRLELSTGKGKLIATLDPTLNVRLLDPKGQPLRSFPRGDGDETREAQARFAELKKDVESSGAQQRQRLERAMRDGRRWTSAEASQWLFCHPFLQHLCRGLVWGAEIKQKSKLEQRFFRPNEEQRFVDERDDPFELPSDASVWVAHPLELGDASAWHQLFGDYELVQPFAQLGRTTFTPTKAELSATAIDRVKGVLVDAGKLLGTLEARGWSRDGRGMVNSFRLTWRGGVVVTLKLSPGFEIRELSGDGCEVELGLAQLRSGKSGASVRELGSIGFSEVMLDLAALQS